jgi:hypothetical protein
VRPRGDLVFVGWNKPCAVPAGEYFMVPLRTGSKWEVPRPELPLEWVSRLLCTASWKLTPPTATYDPFITWIIADTCHDAAER